MDDDFPSPGPLDDEQGSVRVRGIEPRPLSADERARCDSMAGRLQTELRRLVESLPEHARSASGMSRHVGVVRNTCQRVVSSLNETQPTAHLLSRLPGVLGLRQLADGFRQAGARAGDVAGLENATEQFQTLLRQLAGSQSRLAERLSMTADSQPDSIDANPELAALRYRQQMFKGAALCTGRQCEVFTAIHVLRTGNDGGPVCERVAVSGVINQIGRPDAIPFTMTSMAGTEPKMGSFKLLDLGPASGHTPTAILDRFSTSPLPMVTSRVANGRLVHTVDSAVADTSTPIDVVTAHRSVIRPNDPTKDIAIPRCTWGQPHLAARHLLFDIYAHREIVKRTVPSVEVQLVDPREAGGPDWSTRMPHTPMLELLGPGIERAASPQYSRQAELTQYVFDELAACAGAGEGAAGSSLWDPREFVGYRVSVPYPMWRCWYCLWFNKME